jgi:hypothetical protein
MSRHGCRTTALVLCFMLASNLLGVSQAFAANGSVQGRVTVASGSLPPGSTVRATPLSGGGAPATAPIGADGSFAIAQLPEGAYQFEVVGPDGAILGPARKTLVSPKAIQLNLTARGVAPAAPAPAPTPAAPAPSRPAPAPEPASGGEDKFKGYPAPSKVTSGKKWGIIAAVVGAAAIGVAAGGGNDNQGSPSEP